MAIVPRTSGGIASTLFFAALCMAAVSSDSRAQTAATFPSKPIRVVVPLAAGGTTDTFARMFANYLEKKYKQPVIVENKTGAGQVVGSLYAIQQPADGYTMLAGSNGLAYESIINKETPFNSTRDILPFGILAGSGMFLHTDASLQLKTLAEFIAWVRANPGKLNLGTASVPLAPFEGMRERLGLNWTYVNYKGGAPVETALLAGEVQAYFGDSKMLAYSKTGKLRALAYSGPQRHPAAPDVPTFAESGVGLSDFRYVLWLGMFSVPAVPEDILNKLNADLNDMSRQPDSLKRYETMGWVPIPMSVDEARKDVAATNKQIADVLARGVKLR